MAEETAVSFMRRGPPKVPKGFESLLVDKLAGETDEEYKVCATAMKYTAVTGTTPLENDMIDSYKHFLSAQSRGQFETFA
ncbi:MAG: hypothetical protein ACKPKO_04060, partial [Candidatus Fonsibacter sp.]